MYADRPHNPAVADLDGDGYLELVVPVDNGSVHVYDLSADAEQTGWTMAGYDPGRTGTIPFSGGTQGTERPGFGEEQWQGRDGIVHAHTLADGQGSVIRFHARRLSAARLRIFDVAGREVADLLEAEVPAGFHDVTWNERTTVGTPAPAGVYFARLSLGSGRFHTRLVVVR